MISAQKPEKFVNKIRKGKKLPNCSMCDIIRKKRGDIKENKCLAILIKIVLISSPLPKYKFLNFYSLNGDTLMTKI